MTTIEQEAEELYPIKSSCGSAGTLSKYQLNNLLRQEGFKSFVKSKSYQRQILQAQIDEINNCISEFQNQAEIKSGIENYSDAYNDFIANCRYRKQNLEQKLNEL